MTKCDTCIVKPCGLSSATNPGRIVEMCGSLKMDYQDSKRMRANQKRMRTKHRDPAGKEFMNLYRDKSNMVR